MNRILLASSNPHKISEISSILAEKKSVAIVTLKDFGISLDVEEDGKTLRENSEKKACAIYKLLGIPAVADDTGLFVDALNGEPGVYSARYAGENASYGDNCVKLLNAMKDVPAKKRTAEFVCVICFCVSKEEKYFFEGYCKGKILEKARGSNGFGYDPLFVPDGLDKTFAELSDFEKNKISHRYKALKKFGEFIESYFSGTRGS